MSFLNNPMVKTGKARFLIPKFGTYIQKYFCLPILLYCATNKLANYAAIFIMLNPHYGSIVIPIEPASDYQYAPSPLILWLTRYRKCRRPSAIPINYFIYLRHQPDGIL